MSPRCVGSCLLLAALALPLGCKSKSEPSAAASAEPAPIGVPSASASATPSASVSADAAPVSYPRRAITAGDAPDGSWVSAFSVERVAGNEGLSQAAAVDFCRGQGRSLCTETQWQRACAEDAALGELETWTLNPEGAAAVVRGGATGCVARQVAARDTVAPGRVAVCCDRAVAITTKNPNRAFLLQSAKRLLDYERAVGERQPAQLRKLFADQVVYAGKEQTRDEVVAGFGKVESESRPVLDRCNVELEKLGSDTVLVADCQVFRVGPQNPPAGSERIVFGGEESRIQLVGEPGDMALLGREKKERVRKFLGSD